MRKINKIKGENKMETITQQDRETIQRNISFYDNLKKEAFEYYDKHFIIEYKRSEDKGILTHKDSGKSYSWVNWGRVYRAQLTRMVNHLFKNLRINHRALYGTEFLNQWIHKRT